MEYVRLGRTGLQVSRLCLGTMTFGLQCDEKTSHAILDRAAEAGVSFIDTANVYPIGAGFDIRGRTEEFLPAIPIRRQRELDEHRVLRCRGQSPAGREGAATER